MLSTAFLLAASMVVGQGENSPSHQEHVKELAWLIGRWEGTYVQPEGIFDLGKSGSTVIDEQSFRWVLNKSFIQYNSTSRIDGRIASEGLELIGWDVTSGKLVHWIFDSTGVHGSGVWRRDGDAWILDWSGTATDNTSISGSSVHRRVDRDTYTWQMVNLKKNGQSILDWRVVEFKRKTDAKPNKGNDKK